MLGVGCTIKSKRCYEVDILPTYSPVKFSRLGLRGGNSGKSRVISHALLRTFSLAVLALLVYATFAAAGVLLSLISSRGDVLLRSPGCSPLNLTTLYNAPHAAVLGAETALAAYSVNEIQQGASYAHSCYPLTAFNGSVLEGSDAPSANCDYFVKPNLNWTTSFPGKCPFTENIYKGPTSDIVELDTGFLNTHDELGRNSIKSARVVFRRKTTCAPLITAGFTTGFVDDAVLGNVAFFNYGAYLD